MNGQPKTALFQTLDLDLDANRAFESDLQALLGLKESTRETVLDNLLPYFRKRTEDEQQQLLRTIADDTGEPLFNVANAVDWLKFMVRQLSRPEYSEDAPEDLCHDLTSLGVVDGDRATEIQSVLERLKTTILPQYATLTRQRQTVAGVGPSLSSIGTTVELRAVMRDPYRVTVPTPLDEYEANIEDFVGVVSVALETDDGERFFFQADREAFDRLLNKLMAAERDLTAVEGYRTA